MTQNVMNSCNHARGDGLGVPTLEPETYLFERSNLVTTTKQRQESPGVNQRSRNGGFQVAYLSL